MTIPLTPTVQQALQRDLSSGAWSAVTRRFFQNITDGVNANTDNITNIINQNITVIASEFGVGPTSSGLPLPQVLGDVGPVFVEHGVSPFGVEPWP